MVFSVGAQAVRAATGANLAPDSRNGGHVRQSVSGKNWSCSHPRLRRTFTAQHPAPRSPFLDDGGEYHFELLRRLRPRERRLA
jgi:hypothetical protein